MHTSTLSWPRGVSFALIADIPARYPDATFAGYAPKAQLRRTNGTLIAELQAAWLDATNAVLGIDGRINSSTYPHVGAERSIAFSPGGELLVTSNISAPWRSVFRVGPDFVLTPMFAMPDASMDISDRGCSAVFTPDSRCIVTKSATSTTLQLIRSDTTKLIVPRLTNGWIKT